MASSSFLLPSTAATSACPPLKKPTATLSRTKRGRRLSCKATATTGAGDDQLVRRLDRRDVLLGLTGVAAATTSDLVLPGLALAGDGEGATKPKCVTGKITDITCRFDGGFRCPVGEYRPEDVVDFSTLPPPTGPARVRRPAHRVQCDRAYVEKYEQAIRKMKELDVTEPDNPHSFKNQAAIHEAYCDFHYKVAAAAEGNNPPEEEVSFDVHFSSIFAPWHRMYIYFFERILGELAGDSAFALPYWNWDAREGMVVPEMYTKACSPLYDAKRNPEHVSAVIDLNLGPGKEQGLRPCNGDNACQIETNLCTLYRQMSAETAEQFLGGKFCAGRVKLPGSLENVAHTAVHIWVGNPADKNEDMGVLGKAARDPVFYAHHANVDRMWHLWTTKLAGKDHFAAGDGDDEWLDTSFVFHDEKKRLVRIRVRDVVDTRRLGYTYEEEKLEWLDKRPRPAADIQRPLIKMRSAKRSSPASLFPLIVKTGNKEYVTVERPEEARRAAAREAPEVLVVDVTFDPCEYAKLDVLVNVPRGQEGRVGPQNSEFAGSFVNLPHGSDGGMGTLTLSNRFALRELLEDLEIARDRLLDITLVPVAGKKVAVDGVRVELLR